MMLPPPPATEEDLRSISTLLEVEDLELDEPPKGYRWVRCPSCEELHLRPGTVRTEPLRAGPRTDTIPASPILLRR